MGRTPSTHFHTNTSKTPLGREATVGCGLLGPGRPRHRVTTGRNTRWNALWNAPGRGITALTHLGVSSDEMDVEIELSVSRNPRKHPSHHQTMTTPHSSKKRSQKAFRPAGRPYGCRQVVILMGNLRLQLAFERLTVR